MTHPIRRRWFTLVALDAWLALLNAGHAVLETMAGIRIGVRAWVRGALSWLVPPAVTDGGYGVIASVDSATQVTLAAGHSLLAGGSVERWDISGGARLGPVEYSRSALVVQLSDTAGLAAGDVLYDESLRFTAYASLAACLTALGSGFDRPAALVNRTTGAVIGRWGWVGAAIAPLGPISLDLVSTTPVGTAASVAGAVVTLAALHSITQKDKILRVWNVTDAALVADVPSGLWSVAGNDVLMPAATATAIAALLGASKVVRCWVEGVSEFSIGGDVQLASGDTAKFSSGLVVVGAPTMGFVPVLSVAGASLSATILAGYTITADDDYVMIGWRKGNVSVCGGVFRYAVNHLEYGGRRVNGTNSPSAIIDSGTARDVRLASVATAATASFYASTLNSSIGSLASSIAPADIIGGKCILAANKGATFSSIRVL